MKFIDEATIFVKAGDGGSGIVHWRREKFLPTGGPDGGDGGNGGAVIFEADQNLNTLVDYTYNPHIVGHNGEPGAENQKSGKAGENIVLKIPVGTQVFFDNKLVADLSAPLMRWIVARGGRGGKGNTHFKKATKQAPDFAQPGIAGEERTFRLVLKSVADLGLVGLPNAGKSSLISSISKATPKVADYPFTTIAPNLGVVFLSDNRKFVVADIPGLIPGASQGKGLGIRFLKHVERCAVIAHLLDLTQLDLDENADLLATFEAINQDLKNFSEEIAQRKQIVVLSKVDSVSSEELALKVKKSFEERGHETMIISSVTGAGIADFIEKCADYVDKLYKS